MRFQAGHAAVRAEGFGASTKFSISASAKAFRGLIDGLYSRKIEAAIRELSTNAFDAHKAAGTLVPFDIHLPTPLKPSFWIRDYGTGMSHDFMMSRFAIMFESTKDGLNEADAHLITPDDQVGCLGLGRMSFFTYTDTCTITVWQDGYAMFYTVFIGETGEPEVAHAGTVVSDEPAGVKVEFAVKNRDMKSFQTAAIRVFKGFPILPHGLPIDVRDAIKTEPLQVGGFWKAYPKSYLPDGGFYARQGCVIYPIDLFQIDDRLIVTEAADGDEDDVAVELSEEFARFANLDMTIVMDFPIGAIDFDLSRERLAYNDRTVEAIRQRWGQFLSDLDEVIHTNFDGRSGFERCATARLPAFANLGPLFEQSDFFLQASAVEEYIHKLLPKSRGKFNSENAFQRVVVFKDQEGVRDHVFTYSGRAASGAPKQAEVSNAIFVFRDDSGRYLNGRIHYHLQQIGKTHAYVFEPGYLSWAVYNKMGRPPIVRASELVKPPKDVEEKMIRRSGGVGGSFDRIKIIENGAWRAATQDDDTDGSLFALIHRGLVINPDPDRYPDISGEDVNALHELLALTGGPSIAIVNTRSNDKPGRWDDLPLVYDVLDTFAERLTKKQIGQCVAWINDERFTTSRYRSAITALSKRWGSVEGLHRSPLVKLFDRYNLSKSQTAPDLQGAFEQLHSSKNPAMEKIVNDIIHIATSMGMEVLPPCEGGRFPSPLLSKEWEVKVDLMNSSGKYHSDRDKTIKTILNILNAS
ncbi:hypothetical protein LAV_00076 [Sphingobium phage Lacusarx]|uniref:Uncharacterized protein n=1 Tax=Sphingobium phage Lacusarx TaxID=1980139 RepID=A0A1W6DX90_9CAUD|nr:RIIA lysis inhibitor [Sphingobium phage Lacusarx]ARK07476.1 hypothetical protein LAV_00076 [Sphingobium phage Lacusarx]